MPMLPCAHAPVQHQQNLQLNNNPDVMKHKLDAGQVQGWEWKGAKQEAEGG